MSALPLLLTITRSVSTINPRAQMRKLRLREGTGAQSIPLALAGLAFVASFGEGRDDAQLTPRPGPPTESRQARLSTQ